MPNLLEEDLSAPVQEWLRGYGCDRVYTEVLSYGRAVDVVGVMGNELLAVEMKVHLNQRVVDQAMLCQLFAPRTWVAVGRPPVGPVSTAMVELVRKLGIGLLLVEGGVCRGLVNPVRGGHINKALAREMIRRLGVQKKGGVAGRPAGRGVGPAQHVYDLVQEFRAENPDATWSQIYDAVPNHYANAISLNGGMRQVEEARARWKGPRHV